MKLSKALALKYRPKTFSDLTEQDAVVRILTTQIETNTIKHGYLFCGGAGTGKTTSARIFADMINKGKGEPIELDAASNNSVDDIRRITEQAQTKSLDSDFKVFVIDECHSLSNQAWQAFLKTLEEPPAKSIFVLCTTNPEKIPATILSRVQRYNFQRISFEGVVRRLEYIIDEESLYYSNKYTWEKSAIELIAKLADGGMRDAITLMDKCLSYSNELTQETVIKALGIADYGTMFDFTDYIFKRDTANVISSINDIYDSGLDLKQFAKNYFEFMLDINIFGVLGDIKATKIPNTWQDTLNGYSDSDYDICSKLLPFLVDLQSLIKWEHNAKAVITAKFIIFVESIKQEE